MISYKEETEALQILDKFGEVQELNLSSDWDQKLMIRINEAKKSGNSKVYFSTLSILIILMVLFNAGIVLRIINNADYHTVSQAIEYNTLSKELFINPISNN